MVSNLPESNQQRGNRRGCYLVLALIVLALAAFAWLSSQTRDHQEANEVIGRGVPGER